MTRHGSVLRLAPGAQERYEELHADVWQSVLDAQRSVGITNFSIYRHGDLLFSYFEYIGVDMVADWARLSAVQEIQDWWAICVPLQEKVPDAADSEWWHALPEVFHAD